MEIYLKNLSKILSARRVSQGELAKKIGVQQPYISKLKRLEQAGSLDVAYGIADALGVTIDYLIGRTELISEEPIGSDFLRVPIIEPKLAAGSPDMIASEKVIEYAAIHKRALRNAGSRKLVCTFVRGDSMVPALRDGAIVCIDLLARPEKKKIPTGSIWAVRKDEGAVVKYLQIRDNIIVLISENTAYPVELVKDPEAIIGKVVWSWQTL